MMSSKYALRAVQSAFKCTIAIRRETVSIWERRAPLAPEHVRRLTNERNVRVLVEPCNRRVFTNDEYARAGAIIREDISEASVILGVKAVPIDNLLPDKTYCFFSHTIKAQADNMPLLDAVRAKRIRLIDYEAMRDADGRRLVAFGRIAGRAGMIDILHGLGLRLLALGYETPFMRIALAHSYSGSEEAKEAVRRVGEAIASGALPSAIGPLTFVFTGSGNVSQGAREIFGELPHEFVHPADLPTIRQRGKTTQLYACIVSHRHHYYRIDDKGGAIDFTDLTKYPHLYDSNFARTIAPYASVIVNGIYWPPKSSHLLSKADCKRLTAETAPSLGVGLLAVCDISADLRGSMEFVDECTTIDRAFRLYDPLGECASANLAGRGLLFCSIDNMPTQLPREATEWFGEQLMPYMQDLIRSDAKTTFDEYEACTTVKNATITSNGRLTERFRYIDELRNAHVA